MWSALSAPAIGRSVLVLLAITAVQSGPAPSPRDFGDEQEWLLESAAPADEHEFTFARAAYSGWGWGRMCAWNAIPPWFMAA